MQLWYIICYKFVAIIHLIIIVLNILAIPMVLIFEPFYIWMPIITVLVSPLLGGTYCVFNRLENHYRKKAGVRLITDRLEELLRRN